MNYPFPGSNARALVDNAVRLYALGKWSRQQMMTYIADMLDGYRITRLPVNNYVVRRVEPVTVDWPYPVVLIEAWSGVYDRCPACGSGCWRYLGGEAPAVEAWCLGCGCIYKMEVLSDEEVGQGG